MAHVEGRKLQLAGGSTYLVSLPKRWVVAAGLKAGDTIFLETATDGSVSIRARDAGRNEVRRKIFIEREDGSREHLLRKLVGAYVSGFGLIEIRFPPANASFVRRVAREFCRLVIGPEVIEDNRNSLVVQDLSDPTDLSVEKCLRRMQLTVRAMLEDSVTALRTSEASLARDVEQRSEDVNRLYWMVAKQYHLAQTFALSSGSNGHTTMTTGYLLISKFLDGIGNHAQRIAATFPALAEGKTLDPKLAKELEEVTASVINLLDKAFNALVTRDIAAANQTIDDRLTYQKLIDGLSNRIALKRGDELFALGAVVNSLSRAAGFTAEIAEQTIDIAVMTEKDTP